MAGGHKVGLVVACCNVAAAPIARVNAGDHNALARRIADELTVPYVYANMINLTRLAHAEHDQISYSQMGLARYWCTESRLGFGAPRDINAILLEYELGE